MMIVILREMGGKEFFRIEAEEPCIHAGAASIAFVEAYPDELIITLEGVPAFIARDGFIGDLFMFSDMVDRDGFTQVWPEPTKPESETE